MVIDTAILNSPRKRQVVGKAVDGEINRLQKEGQIEEISDTKNIVFIQPTIKPTKKDRTVKTALDATALIQAIDNDRYQMPNLENLSEMVAEKLDTEKVRRGFQRRLITHMAKSHYIKYQQNSATERTDL